MFLFCFVFSFIFRDDTSLFLFNLIFENLILRIFLIILIIIPCSGMFRNVPCYWFYQRPRETHFNTILINYFHKPASLQKNFLGRQLSIQVFSASGHYGLNVSPRMNTIASRDQFKSIRIGGLQRKWFRSLLFTL